MLEFEFAEKKTDFDNYYVFKDVNDLDKIIEISIEKKFIKK
jgi:hypothetical protein